MTHCNLASNIVKHLDGQGILYDLKHGFREKRSFETQLIMLIEDLASCASVEKQTDIILLDFSKDFDRINHSKLLWMLQQCGIRGQVLSLVRAFLEMTTAGSNRLREIRIYTSNIRCPTGLNSVPYLIQHLYK